MDKSLPNFRSSYTLYDIFGYLLPGFFAIFLMILDFDIARVYRGLNQSKQFDAVFNQKPDVFKTQEFVNLLSGNTNDYHSLAVIFILIVFCYLIGHLVSGFSSLLLERLVVKWFTKYPSKFLLDPDWKLNELKSVKNSCITRFCIWNRIHNVWFKFIRRFANPMTKDVVNKLKEKYKDTFGHQLNSQDSYWLAYSYLIAKAPYLSDRVHHFVHLYGFSRNIAGVFWGYVIVKILVIFFFNQFLIDSASWFVLTIYFIGGSLMFIAYLKLFTRQAKDVYMLFLSVTSITEQESKIGQNG